MQLYIYKFAKIINEVCFPGVILRSRDGVEKVREQWMLRLARLAPDVVENIARGQKALGVLLEFFMRNSMPDNWDAQRGVIGSLAR